MWLQEEPQRSTSMWNSRLEAQGAGPLGGTSAVGDIKGYSVDNWRGLEGHPARGGGAVERDCRAPWLPSPARLSVCRCYFGEQ